MILNANFIEAAMSCILTKRFGITKAELWFDMTPCGLKVDVVHHNQCLQHNQCLCKLKRGVSETFYTLVQPLAEDDPTIFSRIQKRSQTEIRRADREGLEFRALPTTSKSIRDFYLFFNEFARSKNRHQISLRWLEAMAGVGMLKLTAALKDGETLVLHSYVFTPRRARLLHSISHFRTLDSSMKNAIARANRWLHWQDILYFKHLGVLEYDFGGWYEGQEDAEKLRINNFKKSFGASLQKNYNCLYATTLKGRASLAFLPLYALMRHWWPAFSLR
jgi:hypothetical protein